MKKLLLLILFFAYSFSSNAQNGVALSVDYEIPLGELSEIYNPTIGLAASYLISNDKLLCNFSLGYFSFGTKQDTFHYNVNSNESGVATYSNYTVIPLYAGLSYKISLFEKLDIHVGGDLGYYFTRFSIQTKDPYVSLDQTTVEGKGVVSPKVGLFYKVNESIEIGFRSKYNLLFTSGSSDSSSPSNIYNLRQVDSTWSNGLIFAFFF